MAQGFGAYVAKQAALYRGLKTRYRLIQNPDSEGEVASVNENMGDKDGILVPQVYASDSEEEVLPPESDDESAEDWDEGG